MRRAAPVFFGWYIVAAGVMAYTLGYGARYSFSVIFPSLLKEFGWPRDVTAAMLSIHMLAYGVVAPGAGALVDSIGPRITMGFGTILLAAGLAVSSLSSEPWHFYLTFGVLCGAGLSLIGAVPFTSVIRNWFDRKRGLALSLMFFGAGGAFALYPAIAFLVEGLGWRKTFVTEGCVVAGLLLPMIFFFVRYHPREIGLRADGAPEGIPSAVEAEAAPGAAQAWAAVDWNLAKAARTGRFWLLCLSTFSLWGIMEHIMVAHHVAFATDAGYSDIYASSVLSLVGVLFAFGSLLAFVSDRIGREATMTIGTAAGISGILVFSFVHDQSHPWMLYFYSIAMGLGLGVTAPTIAASATDIFQGQKVGAVIGAIWFSFSVGGFVGPWLGGWLFETTGSYAVAFATAAATYAVGCGAIWLAAPRTLRRLA